MMPGHIRDLRLLTRRHRFYHLKDKAVKDTESKLVSHLSANFYMHNAPLVSSHLTDFSCPILSMIEFHANYYSNITRISRFFVSEKDI